MKEIFKRNLSHKLFLISDDPGPFPREEYEYLLEYQITSDQLDKIVPTSTMISVTTNPLLRPKPKIQLLYTDWEGSRIPQFYKETCSKADLVLVPSIFARDAFYAGRFEGKVAIAPHGVDKTVLPIQDPSGPFTFRTIAANDWRKGLDILIQAFKEEFKPKEARLHIHCPVKPFGLSKNIIYSYDPVPFSRMGDLYKGSHCFVLPTRGEGFCLPALEAIASGLPVCITEFGGHIDFLQDDYFPIEISHTIKRPGHDHISDYQFIEYYEPSIASLKEQMRFIYENWDYARKITLRGTLRVRNTYTWTRTLDCIEEIVRAIS